MVPELQQYHGKNPSTVACSYDSSQVSGMPGLFPLGLGVAGVGAACFGSSMAGSLVCADAALFIQCTGPDEFETPVISKGKKAF